MTLGRSMCGSAGRGAAESVVMPSILRPCPATAQTGAPPSVGGLSPGLQEGQHSQDAAVVVVAGGQIELAEDARDVLLDGSGPDDHLARDRRVRASLGHELEHL